MIWTRTDSLKATPPICQYILMHFVGWITHGLCCCTMMQGISAFGKCAMCCSAFNLWYLNHLVPFCSRLHHLIRCLPAALPQFLFHIPCEGLRQAEPQKYLSAPFFDKLCKFALQSTIISQHQQASHQRMVQLNKTHNSRKCIRFTCCRMIHGWIVDWPEFHYLIALIQTWSYGSILFAACQVHRAHSIGLYKTDAHTVSCNEYMSQH